MAYRDSTTASGNSATPSVSAPAGVANNDIVIIAISIDSTAATVDAGDLPTGFTELAETDITADGHTAWIGWKRAGGSEPATYTFGDVGATSDWVCQAIALSGRDTGNPPVASSTAVQNTPQSPPVSINANGVTAQNGDDLVWVGVPDVTSSGSGNGMTAPGTYTEAEDAELAWSNLSIAYKENVSAGATGTVTGTFAMSADTCGWAAWLIRVPQSGGAPATKVKDVIGTGIVPRAR